MSQKTLSVPPKVDLEHVLKAPLNGSKSKQAHQFSKARRFSQISFRNGDYNYIVGPDERRLSPNKT